MQTPCLCCRSRHFTGGELDTQRFTTRVNVTAVMNIDISLVPTPRALELRDKVSQRISFIGRRFVGCR